MTRLARIAAALVLAAASLPALAQPLTLVESFEGRVRHTGLGATFRTAANGTSGTAPNEVNNACTVSATSSRTLSGIPAGATVTAAYLYWAGSTTQTNDVPDGDWTVSLDGTDVTAPAALRFTDVFRPASNDLGYFQGAADVTAAVAAKGNGTYTVAGLDIGGTDAQGSAHCSVSAVVKAWSLHVVYSSPTLASRSRVNLYHGFQSRLGETASSTISDFETPAAGTSRLKYVVWEGDPGQGTDEALRFSANGGANQVVDTTDPFNYAPHRFDGTEGAPVFGVDYDVYDAAGVVPAGSTTGTLDITAASNDLIYLSSVVLDFESFASDLAVAIAASDPAPEVGQTTTLTVDLTNNGPDPSAGVTVAVPVPSGYTLVAESVPPGTTYSGGVWTLPSGLAVGAASQLTLTLRADSDAPATATATANSQDRVEDDLTNNEASVTLDATPPPTPSLGIVKTASAGQVEIGDTVTFTIVVSNPTADDARDVEVTDLLPAEFTFVSAAETSGSYDPGTGLWDIGDVKDGESETLTITVTAASAGTATNTATITATRDPDPDPSNDSSSATVDVQAPLAPAPGLCYAVADNGGANGGNDWLIALRRDMSRASTIGTGTGTNLIEAVAHYPDLPPGTLYAADAGTLGTLDLSTGEFAAIGAFGTGGGVDGEVALSDADGLAFDPLTGRFFASHRREGIPNLEDLLFVVDPATGAHVADAFGSGIDYVVIASAGVGELDIDDLAIDPVTGVLYGVANGTTTDRLVSIDKETGAVANVGAFGVSDFEGLAFAASGELYGTTGTAGGSVANAFFEIDKANGAATFVGAFARGTDHESVACLTDGLNTLAGTAFFDADGDGVYDVGSDTPEPGQTVTLYRDADGSGTLTAGDIPVNTAVTAADGTYSFTVAADGAFAVAAGDLTAGGGVYTTAPSDGAAFAAFGESASGLDAGYSTVADLAVAVAVDDSAPEMGDTVTFTVSLTNDGPAPSTGSTLLGALTGGLTYQSFASADLTYNAATGTFTAGTLAPGETVTATVTATVTGPDPGALSVQVQTSENPDTDSTPGNGVATEDDQDRAAVTPVLPDLEVSVVVDDAAPALGDDVTFTVTLDNAGAAGATGVDVSALLPAGYTFVSATPGQGTYDSGTGAWAVGALAAGGQTALTVVATATTVDPSAFAAEVAAADQPDADSAPGNAATTPEDDDAAVTVTAFPPDLALTVAASTATPGVGEQVTFTVTLDGENGADATGVDVSALLPPGLTFVSAAPSQGTYDAGTGAWSVGAVAGGGQATLAVVATVDEAGPQTLAAEVAAADQPDADSTPGNAGTTPEDDDDAVTVTGQPTDLALALSVSDASAPLGDDVTFTITLDNQSAVGATGVDVSALLPAGYTFVSATPGQGTYDSITGAWSVGALAGGGQTTLTVVATVASPTPDDVSAEVTATNEPDADSTPGNGVATEDDQDSAAVTPGLPDLEVSVAVDDAAPALGEDATFTITLQNIGPADATGVTVAAPLPAGYTFVSATPGASYDAATGTWTVGDLAAGGTLTLTVVATATTVDPLAFAAEVAAADQPDADSTPGDGTGDDAATVAVQAFPPDLALAVTVDQPTATVGQDVTFTVTLDSENGADATGVDVSALLPPGLTFVSATPSQGTYDAGTGAWSVGAVAGGAQATLAVVATVGEAGPQTLAAEVAGADQPDADSTPGNADTTPEDDDDAATVAGQTIDLALAVAVDDPTPTLGDDVTFTLTLDNTGAADATGVTVSAPLPAGYTFVSADPAVQYDPGTGTWTVGDLAAGGTLTLDLVATVAAATPDPLAAEVAAADQPDADSAPGNADTTPEDDDATAGVAVRYADVSVDVSANDIAPSAGDTVTFTVDVANDGTIGATGLDVTSALPPGYTFVSATPGQGTYDAGTGVWTVGALGVGAAATLQITAQANAAGAATFTAEATALDQPDADSTPANGDPAEDDQDSVTLTAQPIDLAVSVAASDAAPGFGEAVTFSVTLDNTGAADATGVVVSAPLPAGYTFVSADPAIQYDPDTGTWTVGDLAAGGSVTLDLVATAETLAASTFEAEVDAADQLDADSTPGNADTTSEDDDAAVVVTAQPTDLALAVTVDDAAPSLGDDVTFTITLDNQSAVGATGVDVSALLPAGYAFVSATPATGSYDSNTGVWSVGALAGGGQTTLQIVATAQTVDPSALAAEVAAADQPDADSAPGNADTTPEDDDAAVVVTAQPTDLALAVTVDDAAPALGDDVTFTITLDNESATDATGVDVSALLPAGLTFVSATPSQGTYDAGTGAWSVGAVAGGAQATLQVVATVDEAGPQTLAAEVAAADQPDADSAPGNAGTTPEDDDDAVTVTGQPTDLAVAIAVDDPTPGFGQDVTFTVTLDNESATDATGVDVAALLPAGYAFVSATPGQGTYDSITGAWSVGALAGGGQTTLTVVATAQTVDPSTATAEITGANEPDADSTPGDGTGDDYATVAVAAQPTDLALAVAVDDPAPALGDDVTFTITLDNQSAVGATGVTVTAPLPAGYTFVSATPGASYDAATGTWTVGDVGAGGTLTLAVVATATTVDPSAFAAEVTGANEPDADSTPGNADTTSEDDDATVAVGAQPTDLALAVAVDDPAPAVGQDVTFTVTLDNESATDATGVDVSALLPPGLTFVSATTATGTYDSDTGSWSVGALAGGAQATLAVVATVDEAGPQTLAAEVAGADQPDADSTPGNAATTPEDDDDAATVTGQPTDLALVVAVDDSAPDFGQAVTFTVTLDNESATDATGVDVSALLPAGYAFVSATPAAGTYDSNTGVWSVGALAGGGQTTLQIVAMAQTLDPSTFGAEVSAASPTDADSTPGNAATTPEDDDDAVTLSAQPTDLALALSASDPAPGVGDEVTLTVTVTNESAVGATGVASALALPAGVTFVSASPAQGSYTEATGAWSVGALAPGASTTLDVVVRIDGPGELDASAEITAADQPDADSVPDDGSTDQDDDDALTLTAQPIDLELTASADDSSPPLGGTVTYTVTLENAADVGATGVAARADLPPGLTFVSAVPSQGTYEEADGSWDVGAVAGGDQATLTVTATVDDPDPDPLTAQVTAADQPDVDSTPGNGVESEDDQQAVALAVEAIDLELALAVDDDTPVPGQDVTFTLTLGNASATDATGVTVSAPLPAGYTFVSADPAVQYDPGTGTWTVGDLAAGGTLTLDLVATVATDAPGTLTAEVAAADQPDVDSTPGNAAVEDDLASATVTPQVIDLALAMTVSDAAPAAGDVVTFVVTVTNEGAVDATGVRVSDELVDQPGVAEIVSVTPSRGTFDGVLWDLGALGAGASETLTVEVRLVADNVAFTNLAEVAAADQPDADSVPLNGSTFEDDDASATATTGGSSSGGEGGLESNGSLAQAIASVLFDRQADRASLADAGAEPEPLAFDRARRAGGTLRRYLPAAGPTGEAAVEVSPTDLLPVTNAREVVAADYLRADGRRLGVVFATATDPGELYEHTKPVCDRLRGATLDTVDLLDVDGKPFVMVRLVQADGSVDYAVSFVAYGPRDGRTVDSRFLLDEYAPDGDDEAVLNLQVWSPSREQTAALVAEVLASLAADGPLAFRNRWGGGYRPGGPDLRTATAASTPALPRVFVRRADYVGGQVHLELYNAGGARTLRLSGGTLARAEGEGRTTFDRTVEIAPGTPQEPVVPVTVETGYLFDVAFFAETELSPAPDRLYLADGVWGVAVDRTSETTALSAFDVDPQPGPVGTPEGQRLVERPARATGTVATWATVYRTLQPGGRSLDLGAYRYVEFTASGRGEAYLLLQKASIASSDQYGAPIRLTPEPRVHRVWFEDLVLADGTGGFTGEDAVALSLTRRSDGTAVPFDLAVSGLRFGGAEGDASAAPAEAALWPALPNPFRGSARVRFDLPEAQTVRLRVFDMLGRQVATVAEGERAAGRHTLRFDAAGLAAGVYVMRLELDGQALTRRMTVVR